MRSRIMQLVLILGMGILSMTLDPTPAVAKAKCNGGLVICTSSCPAYPHLMCQAYGCAAEGASCTYQNCSGVDYAVNCHAP